MQKKFFFDAHPIEPELGTGGGGSIEPELGIDESSPLSLR